MTKEEVRRMLDERRRQCAQRGMPIEDYLDGIVTALFDVASEVLASHDTSQIAPAGPMAVGSAGATGAAAAPTELWRDFLKPFDPPSLKRFDDSAFVSVVRNIC